MAFSSLRFAIAACVLALTAAAAAQASPVTIDFTAMVGPANNMDTEDVFNEGYGANLSGQVIVGSVTIDPSRLANPCGADASCRRSFGAVAVSIGFTLNGITSTVDSGGMPGLFASPASGSVSIHDSSNGGANYFEASAGGMLRQSIGALFDNATLFSATLFSALADNDPSAAIASLAAIGDGAGLAKGGVTLLSPVEHLDADILTIDVRRLAFAGLSANSSVEAPEPASVSLFGLALAALRMARRKRPA